MLFAQRAFGAAASRAAAAVSRVPSCAPIAAATQARFFTTTLACNSRPPAPQSHIRVKRRKKLPYIDVDYTPPSAEEAVNNILYNTPASGPTPVTRHTLNCLVSNEPGVLSRVSGILAARGFNIDSLIVAKTEVPDLSRMTIVLNGQAAEIEQARRQLEDLVPVWAVLDYTHSKVVERELLLVKVWTVPSEHLGEETDAEVEFEGYNEHDLAAHYSAISPLLGASMQRQAITELARLFKGNVVDVSLDSMIVELCAKPDRIDAFLNLMKPFSIIEAARSGVMVMPRSPIRSTYTPPKEDEQIVSTVDATMLPPG